MVPAYQMLTVSAQPVKCQFPLQAVAWPCTSIRHWILQVQVQSEGKAHDLV